MVDDPDREYRDTMQEVMFELKLKTDKFLKKLKKQTGKRKITFSGRG
jgi:hypothetical protein